MYELDTWLLDSQPLIWRSVIVPAEMTLDKLHLVIQTMMDWQNYHLHGFETKSRRRFEMEPQTFAVDSMWRDVFSAIGGKNRAPEDERRFRLRDVFEELKQILAYEYDFGDSWIVGIKLVNTHADAGTFDQCPKCLDGERRGPLEDSGGIWGYQEKLAILNDPDPDDEEHQDIIEWMGGRRFDPAAIDLAAINKALRAVRPARTRSVGGGRVTRRRKQSR